MRVFILLFSFWVSAHAMEPLAEKDCLAFLVTPTNENALAPSISHLFTPQIIARFGIEAGSQGIQILEQVWKDPNRLSRLEILTGVQVTERLMKMEEKIALGINSQLPSQTPRNDRWDYSRRAMNLNSAVLLAGIVFCHINQTDFQTALTYFNPAWEPLLGITLAAVLADILKTKPQVAPSSKKLISSSRVYPFTTELRVESLASLDAPVIGFWQGEIPLHFVRTPLAGERPNDRLQVALLVVLSRNPQGEKTLLIALRENH